MENPEIAELNRLAEIYSQDLQTLIGEVKKVIVGQENILEKMVIATIADGHILLEGVPGLAKTLMINTLANTVDASFSRIQFTPDLLPADILGTKIYNQKDSAFHTKKGPIFANFILADEINRAPPKVQSALLEAMQERQVTISGETFKLPLPFLVMATQNPIETEGTYILPEAQVDRFMFKILIEYPTKEDEGSIVRRMSRGYLPEVDKVIPLDKIQEIKKFKDAINVDDKIVNYVTEIIHATRFPRDYGLDFQGLLEYGASPRASIWMVMAAKVHALLKGRSYVIPEDVIEMAPDILRHRLILTFEAEAEGISSQELIDRTLAKIKIP